MSAELPNVETAYATLLNNVGHGVLLTKLAQRGYPARTQQEAARFIELAAKVAAVKEAAEVKTASAAGDFVGGFSASLDSLMQRMNLPQAEPVKTAEENASEDNLAASFMQSPEIFNSVLAIKAAEAQQIQTQLKMPQA